MRRTLPAAQTGDPLRSAEDHLGEVIRPVAGAEMDKVLNSALAIERGTDAYVGREHYVRFPVITGYDADILMGRAGRPGYSAKMQLPVLRRHSNIGIVARQPLRAMPYPGIKLPLVEIFRQNRTGNDANRIYPAGCLRRHGAYKQHVCQRAPHSTQK